MFGERIRVQLASTPVTAVPPTLRHGSLRFLAWLIEGWPDSFGASIGRDMLWRSLRPNVIAFPPLLSRGPDNPAVRGQLILRRTFRLD